MAISVNSVFIYSLLVVLGLPTHLRDRNPLIAALIVSFRDRILALSLDFLGMIS
jgi:hypothetical protein